jgi:hypothetical protein
LARQAPTLRQPADRPILDLDLDLDMHGQTCTKRKCKEVTVAVSQSPNTRLVVPTSNGIWDIEETRTDRASIRLKGQS